MTTAPPRPRVGGWREGERPEPFSPPADPAAELSGASPDVPVRARLVGALALAALVALGAAIAVGAAGGPSPRLTPSSAAGFPRWFAGPLAPLAPGRVGAGGFWLLVTGMGASYLVALATARALGLRAVVVVVVVLHLVFALAPPLLSTDAFGYLAVARAVALPGGSPYAPAHEALAGDPVLPLLVWQTRPNPYGPLFTVASAPLAALGLAGGLWVVKALAAVMGLGLVALVGWTARRLGRDPVGPVAFVGLNPVAVVWAVGGAHNDTLLMLALGAAVALIVARRELAGGASVAVAAAVKASAGLLAPILVLGARRRGRALAGVTAGALACGAVAAVVLGSSVTGLPGALADQASLLSPNSVPHLVGKALGLPGATPAVRALAAAALVGALLLAYARTARGADPITAAGWATIAMLVTTTWLMPWYVVWVLPLAALAPSRALKGATLAMCAFVVVVRMPLPLG